MEHLNEHDIEFYLLNFEYKELDEEQLALVSEEIKSEAEYNSLRNFMLAATSEKDEGIIPPPAIKANLMQEFAKAHSNGFWASTGLFLFPKNKPAYAKPGVQLLAIAASIVLIFTVFVNYENKQTNVALNKDTQQPQQKMAEEQKLLEKGKMVHEEGEKGGEIEATGEEAENEKNEEAPAPVERYNYNVSTGDANGDYTFSEKEQATDELSLETTTSYGSTANFDKSAQEEIVVSDIAEEDNRARYQNDADYSSISQNQNELSAAEEVTLADDEAQIISGYTDATTETATTGKKLNKVRSAAPASATMDSRNAARNEFKKEKADLPLNSRTLNQDKPLIGVLYTAM